MKKTLIAALLVSGLSIGCVSPSQLRQRPPDLELNSAKDARLVATCITDRWGNYSTAKITPVDMRSTAKGFAMTTDSFGSLAPLIEVEEVGSGSSTRLYQLLPVSDGFRALLHDCQ